MVQKNFILTDIMKTGNHIELEEFIKFSELDNQQFEMTGEWYRLHNFDLDKYHRKIALFDLRPAMATLLDNKHFVVDLTKRYEWLIKNNFTIVIANPWESKKFSLYKKKLPFDKKIIWSGDSSWFWYKMYRRYKEVKLKFNHLDKKYDFLYLNKTSRPHRELLFNKLNEQNLLSNSLYSFLSKQIKLDKRYELPWVDPDNYPSYGNDRDIFEPQFNSTTFNIVSETIVHDEVFMTEKIWKPIIAGQLFIVHGKCHYLEDLRLLGFQTYGDFIDESYDSIESLEQRTDAVAEICRELKEKSYTQLYTDTEEIREHNQKIFFSEQHCRAVCKKTISELLELVDSSQVSS